MNAPARFDLLVTNDDGIDAPGLTALAEAAALLPGARVWVVAPDHERSGASQALTLDRPMKVTPQGERRFSVSGGPIDCVKLALIELMPRPALVLSGVNPGANLGADTNYSGTVGAALEAARFGLPGVAVSCLDRAGDFTAAARIGATVAARVLAAGGLPAGMILNVNVPRPVLGADPANPATMSMGSMPWRITELGGVQRVGKVRRVADPWGRARYWIGGGERLPARPGEGGAPLADGCVSVTPLRAISTSSAGIGWAERHLLAPAVEGRIDPRPDST